MTKKPNIATAGRNAAADSRVSAKKDAGGLRNCCSHLCEVSQTHGVSLV